jgi:hypothetical protein
MRQFSPNCFEKISYEPHRAVTPESCTLTSTWITSQNTGSLQKMFSPTPPDKGRKKPG